MTYSPEYEYENESSIDSKLICAICLHPFIKPKITICKHIFCHYCIGLWLKKSLSCPICRQVLPEKHVKSVRTKNLLIKLDQLEIKCLLCQQIGIQRKDLLHHQTNCKSKFKLKIENLINEYSSNSKISLNNEELTDDDIPMIIQIAIINKQCKILDLGNNQIISYGILKLAESLENNSTLKMLSLHRNLLTESAIFYLAERLSLNNSVLKWLDLESTDLTDNSAEYLAIMLIRNKSITGLWLSNNRIGYHGVTMLTSALVLHNKTLKYLDLENNQSINDSSFDCLMEMIQQNQSLKKVYLNNCQLSITSKTLLRNIADTKTNFRIFL